MTPADVTYVDDTEPEPTDVALQNMICTVAAWQVTLVSSKSSKFNMELASAMEQFITEATTALSTLMVPEMAHPNLSYFESQRYELKCAVAGKPVEDLTD